MKRTVYLILMILSVACTSRQTGGSTGQNNAQLDSIIRICREQGSRYRNESRFSEALDAHKKGLEAAMEASDTFEIIQALNNIGTDYRRMGILEDASSSHYQALTYSEKLSDKQSRRAVKCRVVSLNGIGNVQFTLGNLEVADSVFRLALAGEKSLGSKLGQAINYANLGSIFESRAQTDSAWAYYRKSMELNMAIDSNVGISLCHTYFGRLYQKEGKTDKAIEEYKLAYDAMASSSDVWHQLESCLSLSGAYIAGGQFSLAAKYLDEAQETASRIGSREHLAEVYRLEYELQRKRGNTVAALDAYIKSREYADSLASEQSLIHLQNVRIKYERERSQAEIGAINRNWQIERKSKNMILTVLIAAVALALIAIAILIYSLSVRNHNHRILKEMEKMKTMLFTNIAHEFRTPLTVIKAAAEDIRDESGDLPQIREDAVDILRNGGSLINLINQILDIARMSAGSDNVTPSYKRGDIAAFVRTICEANKAFARSRDIIIKCSGEQTVIADFIPDYVYKTTVNLVSNAIKFSEEGGEVRVGITSNDTDVIISVSDDGRGMTPEQIQNSFKLFYQANPDGKTIGSGIGLSLVKLSVDAMGGSISVNSKPGVGSRFVVTLPLHCKEGTAEAFDPGQFGIFPEQPECETTGMVSEQLSGIEGAFRILIVEDTPEVAKWQMKHLDTNYDYYFATNGLEGLKKAEELVPDLIITDIMMPEMDGFEFCRKLRASEMLNHIPVIMVTARATHEDRMLGLEAGADAYLEKPFHADELKIRVDKLLEQRRLLQKKWQAESTGGTSEEAIQASPSERTRLQRGEEFSRKVQSLIDLLLEQNRLSHDTLANELHITKTQLNRKFKAVTGCTVSDEILLRRIEMAKRLLDNEDLLVGEIASSCGIDDVSYFGAVFKKVTGMTPSQYRKRES